MKTVGIIEDQTSIREMMIHAVLDPNGFEVVFSTDNGQEGYDKCVELEPDFIILDAMLPNSNGLETLQRLSQQLPELRVLVFSGYPSPQLIREFLQAGAHGFVEKSAPLEELRKGVEKVSSGGSYFGPEATDLLRDAMSKTDQRTASRLTKREEEILRLIAESHSTKGIAEKLSITFKTAEKHRTNLMRKLDLHDVASLTRYAINKGLVIIEDHW